MKYHPNVSPRSLTTTDNHLTQYPAYWELMQWYLCWRKYPYPTEVIAALVVQDRAEGYSHYPCPLDPVHWHIGRGGDRQERVDKRRRYVQAKRVFRKSVRDEIWRDHVVAQQQKERASDRESA